MDGEPVFVIDRTWQNLSAWGIVSVFDTADGKKAYVYIRQGSKWTITYPDQECGNCWVAYAYPHARINREVWISVEERIPNKGENVLVFATEKYTKGHKFAIDRLEEGEKEPIWMYTHGWIEVTHWMSLPETPEKNAEAL